MPDVVTAGGTAIVMAPLSSVRRIMDVSPPVSTSESARMMATLSAGMPMSVCTVRSALM